MKTLFFLLFSFSVLAQTYTRHTIYQTGPEDNRINVVILGDGFTSSEMNKFRVEAKKFTDFFLNNEPYDYYRNYFNFFAVETPSLESGVSNPGTAPDANPNQPVVKVNNFFGTTFGSGIHRLVIAEKQDRVYEVLASTVPQFDVMVMILNTSYYGGSGGNLSALFTLHDSAPNIGIHEIGHAFAFLGDEYWAGIQYAREKPNMTRNNNPNTIKWKNWLGYNKTGIYPYGETAESSVWFKPRNGRCLMEHINFSLCNVCMETTVERIAQAVNPIEAFSPTKRENVPIYGVQDFSIDLLYPSPNTLKVDWILNGELLDSNKVKFSVTTDMLQGNTNELTARVYDATHLSRQAIEPKYRWVTWSLQKVNQMQIIAPAESVCKGSNISLKTWGCSTTPVWNQSIESDSLNLNISTNTTVIAYCPSTQVYDTLTIQALSLPEIQVSNTGPYQIGDPIQLFASGGIKYEWSGPHEFYSELQNPDIKESQTVNSGNYTVKVTDTNGCINTASTEVIITIVTGNENIAVQIFPNPITDKMTITLPEGQRYSLQLSDESGRVWKKETSTTSITWDTRLLPTGLYILTVKWKEKTVTKKIIKHI